MPGYPKYTWRSMSSMHRQGQSDRSDVSGSGMSDMSDLACQMWPVSGLLTKSDETRLGPRLGRRSQTIRQEKTPENATHYAPMYTHTCTHHAPTCTRVHHAPPGTRHGYRRTVQHGLRCLGRPWGSLSEISCSALARYP